MKPSKYGLISAVTSGFGRRAQLSNTSNYFLSRATEHINRTLENAKFCGAKLLHFILLATLSSNVCFSNLNPCLMITNYDLFTPAKYLSEE